MTTDKLEHINNTIRYTNWSAYQLRGKLVEPDIASEEFNQWVLDLAEQDITLRGAYDIRGFRGDTELLLWLHAPRAEDIQRALSSFLHTQLGQLAVPTWTGMGLHRPAEFNRSHVPGFMLGVEAKKWLCMYPFVRSYDWYLLDESERRDMLIEHGAAGHNYSGITSSTVASFALGDYEWLLALESEDLHEIVDMMRDLRYTKARLHVREEVPFFTGQRIDLQQIGKLFS